MPSMARKTSLKTACDRFDKGLNELLDSAVEFDALNLTDRTRSLAYDGLVIKLFVSFERFMLSAVTAAINNDTSRLSSATDIKFPKHLTDAVCEYIVTKGGYFNFNGRGGLLTDLKTLIGNEHWLRAEIKKPEYRDVLEQLIALRHFAAHESPQSRKRALAAIKQKRLSKSGTWLKSHGRFPKMIEKLRALSVAVSNQAPY